MVLQSILNTVNRPVPAYLFPELDPSQESGDAIKLKNTAIQDSRVFVFQYFPTQVSDSYEVDYATKMIPGGSHPLYQWIGGSGRTISFEATFSCEVDEDTALGSTLSAASNFVAAGVIPSTRYTVDINGAIARLRQFQLPKYQSGIAKAPPKLHLVLPRTLIGGNRDDILCFLKSCRVVYESWFPNGRPRLVTVALEFIETVQRMTANAQSSSIKFLDGEELFKNSAQNYKYRGNIDGLLTV